MDASLTPTACSRYSYSPRELHARLVFICAVCRFGPFKTRVFISFLFYISELANATPEMSEEVHFEYLR